MFDESSMDVKELDGKMLVNFVFDEDGRELAIMENGLESNLLRLAIDLFKGREAIEFMGRVMRMVYHVGSRGKLRRRKRQIRPYLYVLRIDKSFTH
jgi:hypothetical protein